MTYKKIFIWLLILLTLTVLVAMSIHTAFLHTYDAEREGTRNKLKFNDEDLKIFDESFLYKGKPVHPGIIERFITFAISDDWKPKTVSMDIVACTNTNEFFQEFEWSTSGGILTCRLEPKHDFYSDEKRGYFHYHWLGKLDNGVHVIKTEDWGGGSATFHDLLFLKASKGTALTPDGKPYSQILLTFVRTCSAPANVNEIKLLHNKVIGTNPRDASYSFILDFPDTID